MKCIVMVALLAVVGLVFVTLYRHDPIVRQPSYDDVVSGRYRMSASQIAAALNSSSPMDRYAACFQAGRFVDKTFEDELINLLLTDPVPGVCDSAAFGLARLRSDKLAARLLKGEEFPPYTRARISTTLSRTNSDTGIRALRKLLKDSNEQVVEDALFSVHNSPLGKPEDLRSVRNHPSKTIRELAGKLEKQLPTRVLGRLLKGELSPRHR